MATNTVIRVGYVGFPINPNLIKAFENGELALAYAVSGRQMPIPHFPNAGQWAEEFVAVVFTRAPDPANQVEALKNYLLQQMTQMGASGAEVLVRSDPIGANSLIYVQIAIPRHVLVMTTDFDSTFAQELSGFYHGLSAG